MQPYHCRKCKRFMFDSDAASGRLRLSCPYRDCKVSQMVFLGGHFRDRRPMPLQAVPRPEQSRKTATS